MKARAEELLDRAIAATVAAIEMYNKPDFQYLEEAFAVLFANQAASTRADRGLRPSCHGVQRRGASKGDRRMTPREADIASASYAEGRRDERKQHMSGPVIRAAELEALAKEMEAFDLPGGRLLSGYDAASMVRALAARPVEGEKK